MLTDIALSGLVTLLISATVLMASPGPATLSVAAMAAAYGFWHSLAYVAGINLGTILVLLTVAFGASTLLSASPGLSLPVSIAASLYMLYLAYRIGTAAPLVDRMEAPVPGLLPGMLLAIANPKAYVAISAVYTKTVLASGSALFDAILKCVILSSAIIFIHLTWALAGTALTTVLRDPRVSRGVNLALAAALILAVVADGIKWLTPMIGTVADVGRRLQLLCCIGVTSGAGTAGAGLSP